MSDLTTLADLLIARAGSLRDLHVVAGFDGFVDEMIQVVDERQSLSQYRAVGSIPAFAGLIGAAAGRSSLREIVVTGVHAGGCAVNLGDGIASLGVALDYFGTLGQPLHPAFAAFANKCASCTAWGGDPGRTLALEFSDGKYMLSSVTQLAGFDAPLVQRALADGSFAAACRRAGLLAFTNWTLYPHMTACWDLISTQVLATLPRRPWLFIDLVDPRSRSHADIAAMLEVVTGFERHCRTVFGGNLNEANAVAEILGVAQVHQDGPAVAEQAAALRHKLGVSQVATHCIRGAAVADASGAVWAEGPYTPTPKKSTGAGDRFNAGYCLGLLLDLPPRQRLALGAACSGYFVRNAASGDARAVAGLLRMWAAGTLVD